VQLSAQNVEIVRSGRAVDDLDVALFELLLVGGRLVLVTDVIRQLQESFDSGLAVLRALAIHAMGQGQHDARLLLPLVLPACDEVVDYYGSSVTEIAKLGLPDHQAVGVRHCEPVLETKNAELTQMAVGDPDLIGDRLQETVLFNVSFLVTDESVPMREGSSFDILSTHSHSIALVEQSGPGQLLHGRPVERFLAFEVFDSLLVDLLDGGMDIEVRWPGTDFVKEFGKGVDINPGVSTASSGKRSDFIEIALEFSRKIYFFLKDFLVIFLVGIPELLSEILEIVCIDHSSFKQLLRVEVINGRMVLDGLVQQRLGEGRLILFVVAISPVADQVDEDVLFELLAVGNSDLHALVEDVRSISVDVDDRSIDCLGDLGAVEGRTALFESGSETDLVVVYDVNDASRTVVNEVLEPQGLPDHTLTSDGRISMHDNPEHST
jgi:hypothetical protein